MVLLYFLNLLVMQLTHVSQLLLRSLVAKLPVLTLLTYLVVQSNDVLKLLLEVAKLILEVL